MLSDLFYRRKRLTILTLGLISVAGLTALESLPRQEDPALSRRFGDIVTFYPGATAERVEALVTEKIENHILELHEVKELDSISRTGLSVINVGLEDEYDESSVDEVWSRLRDKLADAEAELPDGASVPEFTDQSSVAITLLVGLTWRGEGEPQLALMSRLADELASRLRPLAGTKEVDIHGEAEEELRVTVDPLRLSEVGLDVRSVARAISSADTRRPAGQLRDGFVAVPFEIEGQLSSAARVRGVPVASLANGSVLRVGDVASVEKTRVDPPTTVALMSGNRGVAVAATMLPSSGRVDRWAARARDVVTTFEEEIPHGIGIEILFDQSRYTDERLSGLSLNLALGAAIVVGVLLFMMGLRSALIVSVALPLTLALVLAEFNLIGMPLHQMSMTGLIIALGLLIDNAIVVVDEFELRLRRGLEPAEAIRSVVHDLFVPLGASTLTTVIAFLPIALMPGGGGEFVGPIAIGVGLAVSTSFFLSMTLILTFAGWILPRDHSHQERTGIWSHGYSNPRLTRAYRRTLVATLQRPWIGIGVSLALPLAGFVVMSDLPEQFFPANDRDQFQIQLDLPAHASMSATLDAVARARAVVEAHEEVVSSHWFAGESAPRVFYNMLGNNSVPNFAGAFVTTRSARATEAVLPKIQREIMRAVPEALAIALPFEQGPPFAAPIEVQIIGPELDVLREIGDDVRGILARSEAVTFTRSQLVGGRPKLVLRADEDAAQLVGLRLGDLADQLNDTLDGSVAGRIIEGTEDIPIQVRVGEEARASLATVGSTRMIGASSDGAGRAAGAEGGLVGIPLIALSEMTLVPEFAGITRRLGERVNTIQAFLDPYALIQVSLDDFNRRLSNSGLVVPDGYRIRLGGDFEQRSEAMANLAAYALPLFIIMAGSIILTFNSFRLASIIFSVAALSIGLAMLSVWVMGFPRGFIVIVGAMGLAGLSINDAIVVLNALRIDPRAQDGDAEATAEVVLDASRHILATTATTMGGFLPLILAGGRFWPPMATAIAGGVVGASVIALYYVPALFISARRRAVRIDRRAGSKDAADAADSPEPRPHLIPAPEPGKTSLTA